jgi:hypothetical protein
MHRLFIIIIFFISFGCSSSTYEPESHEPLTTKEFIKNPFTGEINIEKFRKENRNLKYRKYIRTPKSNPSMVDTIYRFFSGKNNILFYKPQQEDEILLINLTVGDKKIRLKNSINPGLKKKEIIQRLSGFPSAKNDTIRINHHNKTGTFIFKGNKLKKIMIYPSKSKRNR